MDILKNYFTELSEKPYQAVLDGYLFVLGFGLTLYLYDGYYGISYDKFLFWKKYSLIFLGLLALSLIVFILRKKPNIQREQILHAWKDMCVTDWCVLSYALINTVSYWFAIEREEALWGTFGWNVGWLSQIIMVFWYFAYKKLYRWHEGSYWCLAGAAVIAMGIGNLQRMGLVTVSDGAGWGFYLSTIGNINWYAGYLSVMVSLILGLFLSRKENRPIITGIWCLILVTAFLACISNGSNSLYGMLMGVFLVTGILSAFSMDRFYRYCLSLAMFGLSLELVYIYTSLGPSEWFFLGNHDNYGVSFASGHKGLIIAFTASGIYILAKQFLSERNPLLSGKEALRVLRLFASIGFGLLALLVFLQVFDLLGLKNSWGNGRGALWRVASFMYQKLSLYRKMIGVGPDCFSIYLDSDAEAFALLTEIYEARRVANAHSELLTMMINIGFLGTLSFYLTCFSKVLSFIPFLFAEDLSKRRQAVILITVIAGVLTHFIVSFQHMMLMPYVFVLLGLNMKGKNQQEKPAEAQRNRREKAAGKRHKKKRKK